MERDLAGIKVVKSYGGSWNGAGSALWTEKVERDNDYSFPKGLPAKKRIELKNKLRALGFQKIKFVDHK